MGIDYDGWIMLEMGSIPDDPVAELAQQPPLFAEMVAKAQAKLGKA